MSMLSDQIKELRNRAKVLRQGDWSDGEEDALLLEDAADTIESMRDKLQAERTCKVDVLDTGNEAAYEHYEYIMHCRSCNHEYGYVQYNEDGDTWQDEKPNYCPHCGAKVKHD